MKAFKNIKRVVALLNKAYGKPPPLRNTDPVDELVRTVLSQNTSDANSLAAFAVLKKKFGSWDELLKTPTVKVARLIRHAGLGNIKAARLKAVLSEIKRREGKLNLANLTRLDTKGALTYLRSLKGVGPKTAACVLLFSFGKPTMPVDTHIFRVTKRMGLIDGRMGIEEAHEALSGKVPKRLIYKFHLGIIEHGRKTCKSQTPRCGVCVVYGLCKFKDKRLYKCKV